MTIEKLAQHARDIARAFNIRVIERASHVDQSELVGRRNKAGDLEGKTVISVPITSEETYATQMHELGHALHPSGYLCGRVKPTTQLQELRLQCDEEDAAWEWAEKNALDWTPTMAHVAQVARSTYQTVHDQIAARGDRPLLSPEEKFFRALFGDNVVGGFTTTEPPPPKPATVKVEPVSAFAGKIKWKGRG